MAKISLGDWDITSDSTTGTLSFSTPGSTQTPLQITDEESVIVKDLLFRATGDVQLGDSSSLDSLHVRSKTAESPPRRGITLPSDPDGQLRLWVHNYQRNARVEVWNGADNSRVAVIYPNGNMAISGELTENASL